MSQLFILSILFNEIAIYPILIVSLLHTKKSTLVIESIAMILFIIAIAFRLVHNGEDTFFFSPSYSVFMVLLSNILFLFVILRAKLRAKEHV